MNQYQQTEIADTILYNGRIATQDERRSFAEAVAIRDGLFLAVGSEAEVIAHRGPTTKMIDVAGRTVVPGLNDSHIHIIRGGLNYNMELRWEGVPSLAEALGMLKAQADRTPAPQWVRVVGGWTEFQFAERRMPTLDEINAAAPETPVFILNLYAKAMLNRAALRAVGYDRNTPNPPRGEIQRDAQGNPTGLLIARPDAALLYATLARGPRLSYDDQINSTRHFMRELNRLGITSAGDAGGGFQRYPEDYQVIQELANRGQLTIRIAYNLFTQRPKEEMSDYRTWTATLKPYAGDDYLRLNGVGEMIVYAAYDFEDFQEPRPATNPDSIAPFKEAIHHLVANRWPFRLHATYDEFVSQYLDVFEAIDRDVPFKGIRWFFDHCETVSERSLERIKALGGGVAVQDRMAFQGEYFVNRYGAKAAEQTPPVRKMLEMGLPVGAGTDATRVSSYNPWVALYWLISGKTAGGLALYPEANRMDRMEALRLYTVGSAWFSQHEGRKGSIMPGQLADLTVLSDDYFTIPEDALKRLESVLTIVGGKVVYAAGAFRSLDPPLPPVSPDWSPTARFSSYGSNEEGRQPAAPVSLASAACGCTSHSLLQNGLGLLPRQWSAPTSRLWGPTGCECWAF